MKFIDPNMEFELVPKSAPDIVVVYRQPSGVTTSTDPSEIPSEYVNKYIVRIEGMEVPEHLKGLPWNSILPVSVANEAFVAIAKQGKLLEDEERD